jgi:hypothetical protein
MIFLGAILSAVRFSFDGAIIRSSLEICCVGNSRWCRERVADIEQIFAGVGGKGTSIAERLSCSNEPRRPKSEVVGHRDVGQSPSATILNFGCILRHASHLSRVKRIKL